MAKVISSRRLTGKTAADTKGGYYLLEAALAGHIPAGGPPSREGRMGQFYMIRSWNNYPFLSRPISVFDAGGGKVSFVYRVTGKGTELLSALRENDDIKLLGPLGHGFPEQRGNIALVGGGAGIAPLYLAARELKSLDRTSRISAFLGYSGEAFLADSFEEAADRVVPKTGGFITDEVDPSRYDYIFSCGPGVMMKALYKKCLAAGKGGSLYVSLENRMACGVGACFVCSCAARGGNKKVCRDGPVFRADEVFEA